jgi:eukaryotic-like serine/threonine-protein kinase
MGGSRSSAPGPLPARLGQRFALGDLIGRGTCSAVYRAHDLLLDRDAAVKIFQVADDPRIEREVALMASLDHPSLVPVFDVGWDDDRAFVVMSLLEGGNLVDRLADGPLHVTETLLAVASVADGLAHVHRAGVLHRDVTPRNVLFDADGRAHLSDFGVALVADAPRITDTGIVVGSAPYLAPEQVRGDAVGPPADVYALGLVMIEALTARPAYDGSPLAAARARLAQRPGIPPGLDAEVVTLLEAMTADDPADRPAADRVCVGLRRAALAAETVTPLAAVAPVAGTGLACVVPDATTDPLSGVGAAAGTVAAAPVGLPSPAPEAPAAEFPQPGEAPRRRRAGIAEAGGLAVVASVAAAVLLAGGVVVASAWTVDSVSASAPPSATVAPPSAEVAIDPGAGATDGPDTGASDAAAERGHSSHEARPVTSRARSEGEAPSRRTATAPSTDGGSSTASRAPSSTPPSSAPSWSTPTSTPTSTKPTGSSTPTTRPLLPDLPLPTVHLPLPTETRTDEPSETTEPSTPAPSTSTTQATSTPASPTTTTDASAERRAPLLEALGG